MFKHEKIIKFLNFLNNHDFLISGDSEGKVILWRIWFGNEKFKMDKIILEGNEIYSIAFNDNILAICSKDSPVRFVEF